MLYLQNPKILLKKFPSCGRNATIAGCWKEWFRGPTFFVRNWQHTTVRKSKCALPDRYRQFEYCRIPLLKQHFLKDSELEPKTSNNEKVLSKPSYLLSYTDVVAKRWTGWNNCSFLKELSSWMDAFYLLNIFRLYAGVKMSFEHIID